MTFNGPTAGFDLKSVWTKVFMRDKTVAWITKLLEEEDVMHLRLMEIAGAALPDIAPDQIP